MSDDFETLVAQGKALYSDLVARSWEILVTRTDATSPAAIEATCDLQRNLVVAGAEWIALCERVLALSATAEAATAAFVPSRVSDVVESTSAHQAPEVPSPSGRTQRTPRTRSQARTGAAPSQQTAGMLPVPQPDRSGVVSPRSANVPLNGQTAYRIFPLILDSAPAHVQLVAMSFNGAEWHPIAAWRRIYQQVVQSLQRSDPERFDTLATTLTMSNGRPLFSRDRSVYMAPIDAGGGWFATGQMPTELILQRLRMLVDWWGLPRESLSVEVMPEARAPVAVGPETEEQASSAAESQPLATEELQPSPGARIEDLPTLSEEAPAQSLAQVEPADVDVAVTADDAVAPAVASSEAVSSSGVTVAEVELIGAAAPTGGAREDATMDEATETEASSTADEAPGEEAPAVVDELAISAAAVTDPAEMPEVAESEAAGVEAIDTTDAAVVAQAGPVETRLAEEADEATGQPSEETLAEVLPPVSVDAEAAQSGSMEAAPVPRTPEVDPQPAGDPVNGTEARVTETPLSVAPTPVNEVVDSVHVLPDVQPQATLPEEFTPPPTAQQSNVRWVKTINGTRLPLRPATDD